jgi:hypothetical protein
MDLAGTVAPHECNFIILLQNEVERQALFETRPTIRRAVGGGVAIDRRAWTNRTPLPKQMRMKLTPENQDYMDSRPINEESPVRTPGWLAKRIAERRAGKSQSVNSSLSKAEDAEARDQTTTDEPPARV